MIYVTLITYFIVVFIAVYRLAASFDLWSLKWETNYTFGICKKEKEFKIMYKKKK